jgi:putative FmdB family regulatory protein
MPEYPYRCAACDNHWDESRSITAAFDPSHCPKCGRKESEQDYTRKMVRGHVSSEGNWSGGKTVVQLHPNHPDKMVTSKKQMEKVYRKNGISMETGHFVSKEAQLQATVPLKQRLHSSTTKNATYGGIIEEK